MVWWGQTIVWPEQTIRPQNEARKKKEDLDVENNSKLPIFNISLSTNKEHTLHLSELFYRTQTMPSCLRELQFAMIRLEERQFRSISLQLKTVGHKDYWQDKTQAAGH